MSDCRKKIGVCSFNGKCYKDGSKKPDEDCFLCKMGVWINEKRKSSIEHLKLFFQNLFEKCFHFYLFF